MTTRDMIIARYPKPFIERMQAMIEETNTVNKSRMVAAKDEMLELLRANNASYTMKLKPKKGRMPLQKPRRSWLVSGWRSSSGRQGR